MAAVASRTSRYVAAGLGALLLTALIVAVALNAGRHTTMYAVGSPEAAVQRYFQALIDGRRRDALGELTTDLSERCTAAFVAGQPYQRPSRVVLTETVITDQHATITVEVTETVGGGLLGDDDIVTTQTIALRQAEDGWKIAELPWPLYDCVTKAPS